MNEKQIRERLLAVCAFLDARARATTRRAVVPAMLGVGVALAGCTQDEPSGDAGTDDALPADGQVADNGVQPAYWAPMPDVGAQPLYSAPIDAGALADLGGQPLYAAPLDADLPDLSSPDAGLPADLGAAPADATPRLDGGAVALYSVPDPADATPDAAPDAGAVPLYMVPPDRPA